MKIVLGEAKEEYDTDVQMAVTRQLILRVNTEIKPEEAYVVSEITYSQRTGYSYTLINTQTKERRTTNLIRPLSKRFGVGFYKDDVRMMLMPEPEFKRLCEGAQNIVKKEEVKKDKTRYQLSNDYQGSRYDSKLTTKEIAIKIRAYCKTQYPDYKFSVRVDRSEINVKILSGPQEIREGKGLAKGNWQTIGITDFYKDWLSEGAYKMLYDITQYAKSYNRSDTDIQDDYFDEHFYFRLDIGAWDRPYTVTPEIKPQTGITKSGTLQIIEARIVSQPEANHRSGPEKTI